MLSKATDNLIKAFKARSSPWPSPWLRRIERDLISQRTKEAPRAKKAKGIKLGRPEGPGKSKLDKYRLEIKALLANGSTQKFIADRYGTTETNLHNWMKK